jgi:hypothetical protein
MDETTKVKNTRPHRDLMECQRASCYSSFNIRFVEVAAFIPASNHGFSMCFHHVPMEVPQVPKVFLKLFPIAPPFYPIWFAQSSTLMYIN